ARRDTTSRNLRAGCAAPAAAGSPCPPMSIRVFASCSCDIPDLWRFRRQEVEKGFLRIWLAGGDLLLKWRCRRIGSEDVVDAHRVPKDRHCIGLIAADC